MSSTRVIIQEKPYREHCIGDSVLLPSLVADQKIKAGLARVFGKEDWARQQAQEKDARAFRKKEKAAAKAKAKKHHDENEALRPLVEAKDALAIAENNLAKAEQRAEAATSKKQKKQYKELLPKLRNVAKEAQAAVDKLQPAEQPAEEPAPDPKVDVVD